MNSIVQLYKINELNCSHDLFQRNKISPHMEQASNFPFLKGQKSQQKDMSFEDSGLLHYAIQFRTNKGMKPQF